MLRGARCVEERGSDAALEVVPSVTPLSSVTMSGRLLHACNKMVLEKIATSKGLCLNVIVSSYPILYQHVVLYKYS